MAGSFGRHVSRIAGLALVATLPGCATAPPIANPERLPPEALSLRYVLGEACLPYAMGRKTQDQAFGGAGLRYSTLDIGLASPTGPGWYSRYPGIHRVNTGLYACYFTVFGPDVQTYERVVKALLHERLGADPDIDEQHSAAAIPARFQGAVMGCSRGVRYSYTPLPARMQTGALLSASLKQPGLEVSISEHIC